MGLDLNCFKKEVFDWRLEVLG